MNKWNESMLIHINVNTVYHYGVLLCFGIDGNTWNNDGLTIWTDRALVDGKIRVEPVYYTLETIKML